MHAGFGAAQSDKEDVRGRRTQCGCGVTFNSEAASFLLRLKSESQFNTDFEFIFKPYDWKNVKPSCEFTSFYFHFLLLLHIFFQLNC